MSRLIDYSPLLERVPSAEWKAFRERAKASGMPWATVSPAVIVGLAVVIPVAVVVLIAGGAAFSALVAALSNGTVIPVIGAAVFVTAFGVIAVAAIRGALRGGTWERWARLDRFARTNGLLFSPRSPEPSYPGAIFGIGSARHAVEHFRTTGGRYLDFGNYRYTTGSGKSRRTHTWGFLALHLDRRLPHMVLDSRANNGLFGGTNLPATFDRSQILSLEGDFDRYFTLYCPRRYERDALYVFTPDLMALLIDEAAPFDVEIVDDWMFVYASGGFPSGDEATYRRLFRVAETVGATTLDQTERYRDERVPGSRTADVVAPQGTRLKRRVSIGTLIGVGLIVAVWAWITFGFFGG